MIKKGNEATTVKCLSGFFSCPDSKWFKHVLPVHGFSLEKLLFDRVNPFA